MRINLDATNKKEQASTKHSVWYTLLFLVPYHYPQTAGITKIKSDLFEFNRPRRFRGQIVKHAVHALHLVHDAVHDGLEHRKRNLRALGGHQVVRLHGAERNGVVVGAEIAHYADRTEVREGGKVLAKLALKARLLNFLAVDAVCLLDYLNLLRRDFADDADAESRAREGLAVYELFGEAEL